jgi:acyl carrier protein
MTDLDTRLSKCFAAVFPNLPRGEIERAAVELVESWDSIATATLVTVVCEEFSIPMDFDEVESLTSYAAVRAWITGQLAK